MFVPNTYFIIVLSYNLSSQNNFKKIYDNVADIENAALLFNGVERDHDNYFHVQNLHSKKFEGKNLCKIS